MPPGILRRLSGYALLCYYEMLEQLPSLSRARSEGADPLKAALRFSQFLPQDGLNRGGFHRQGVSQPKPSATLKKKSMQPCGALPHCLFSPLSDDLDELQDASAFATRVLPRNRRHWTEASLSNLRSDLGRSGRAGEAGYPQLDNGCSSRSRCRSRFTKQLLRQ